MILSLQYFLTISIDMSLIHLFKDLLAIIPHSQLWEVANKYYARKQYPEALRYYNAAIVSAYKHIMCMVSSVR